MAPVVLFTASFVVGMIVLGIFQFAIGRIHRLVPLPMGALNALLHGFGFLITLPFVTSLLVKSQGWETETLLAAGFIFLCAAVAFAIGLALLFVWAIRRPAEARA